MGTSGGNNLAEIDMVNELVGKFVERAATLAEGIQQLKRDGMEISEHYEDEEIAAVVKQIAADYVQFEAWLNHLLTEEEIPDGIIALNFGLFEEEDGVRLYVSGSKAFDVENFDWAADNDYFPDGRYADIDVYHSFQDMLESDFSLGLYLSLAASVLYILTYARQNRGLLIKRNEQLHLTTGFDDGGLFYLGTVSKLGFQVVHGK